MEAVEDNCLAIAILQGDKQALGRLYDKYAPVLMGLIGRILDNNILSEEILQATFVQVWNKIGTFDPSKTSLFTWLLITARHLAVEKARSEQLTNPGYNNPVYNATSGNNGEGALPGSVQTFIFDLVYYRGLSCTEVSTVMKIPVETLLKHIRMAIKNMNGVKVI